MSREWAKLFGNLSLTMGPVNHQLQKLIRIISPLLAAPAALLLSQGQAKAILNVNIFDDGPNLKVTVQGSLSQLGSTLGVSQCGYDGYLSGQFNPSLPSLLCTGPTADAPLYAISGPAGYGGNGDLAGASSVSGFTFRFAPSSFPGTSGIRVDPSYTLGQPFSSSAIFNGKSLTSEGFTSTGLVGTWTINGTSESINVFIGPAASTVPGPLPMLGVGAAFGWSRRLRKRIATPLSTPPQA